MTGHASAPSTGTDRERFEEALDLATGGQGAGTLRQLAYPVYVTILIGLTYGFTVTRFVFVASDPAWVAAHLLTPPAAGVLALLVALTAVSVRRLGGRSGAVVPPIAWTDQVLTSSLDRAVALTPWWHLVLAAATTGGGLLGVLLGGSLWASTVTGPVALPVSGLIGAAIGALLAGAGLSGQAGLTRPARPASALRRLRVEDLRAQAATGELLIGSLLAGNVRATQLELAAPPRRGRAARLRPGRPVSTVLRRDLLGLRRDPFSVVRGLVLVGVGSALVAWTAVEPGAPPILAAVGMVLCHIGIGAWVEGLRMSADHVGSPTLYGLWPGRAAIAHTLVPAALVALTWAVVAGPVALAASAGASAAATLLVVGAVVTVSSVATTWTSVFRPPPSEALLMPGSGPQTLVLRMLTPALLAFVVGILLPGAVGVGGLTGVGGVAGADVARLGAALGVLVAWSSLRLRNATRLRGQ